MEKAEYPEGPDEFPIFHELRKSYPYLPLTQTIWVATKAIKENAMRQCLLFGYGDNNVLLLFA